MSFSFIHISDIHLGRPFSDAALAQYNEISEQLYKTAVKKSVNKAVDFAISKQVDFVLISGDTFDDEESDFSSQLFLKEILNRLKEANIKVAAVCGNHDPASSYNKIAFNFSDNSGINIIGVNTPYYSDIPLYDKDNRLIAVVHGLSYKQKSFTKNPKEEFTFVQKGASDVFHIGLLHTELSSDKTNPYAPCNISDLKSLNYDYWALGHIHKPEEYDSSICYAGTIQGRNTKETGIHGFRYVEIENNLIKTNTLIPSDVIRFEKAAVDISNSSNTFEAVDNIIDYLSKFFYNNPGDFEVCILSIELNGFINFYSDIDAKFFETLAEKIESAFGIKIVISEYVNKTKPLVDEELIKEDEGIIGNIYTVINSKTDMEECFSSAYKFLEKAVQGCRFTDDEYEDIKKYVTESAYNECLSICSSVYNCGNGEGLKDDIPLEKGD